MEWPADDLDLISRVLQLSDGAASEQKQLFDYGPLIFPRLVGLLSSGKVGIRAACLDALCRLFRVRGLARTLVSALCGRNGLACSETMVRYECSLALSRVLQSLQSEEREENKVRLEWIRAIPLLVDLAMEEDKVVNAVEQTLIQLRTLIGANTFNRKLARVLVTKFDHHNNFNDCEEEKKQLEEVGSRCRRKASWLLWRLFKGDEGLLSCASSAVDSIKALQLAVEPHPSTAREIVETLLPLLDSFDMEVSEAAMHAIIAHFQYDSCWPIVSSHPLAQTIARQNQSLFPTSQPTQEQSITETMTTRRVRSSRTRSKDSICCEGEVGEFDKQEPFKFHDKRDDGVAEFYASPNASRTSTPTQSNSFRQKDQEKDALQHRQRRDLSSSPESFCSTSSRTTTSGSIRSSPVTVPSSDTESATSSFCSTPAHRRASSCSITIPQSPFSQTGPGGCKTSPAHASFSTQGFLTPSPHGSVRSASPSAKSSVFASAGTSMVRMNAQLSTLKRKTSARKRSNSARTANRESISTPPETSAFSNVGTGNERVDLVSENHPDFGMDTASALLNRKPSRRIRENASVHSAPLSRARSSSADTHHNFGQQQTQQYGHDTHSRNHDYHHYSHSHQQLETQYHQQPEEQHYSQERGGERETRGGSSSSGGSRNGARRSSVSSLRLRQNVHKPSENSNAMHPEVDTLSYPSSREEDIVDAAEPQASARSLGMSNQLPDNVEGLVKLLADDSNWQSQLEVLNAVKNNQYQLAKGARMDANLILGIVKLTSSLRSVLGKNSLVCVHFLITNNGPSFWRDQNPTLIDTVVTALLKKSIDSSAFLAQEAKAALDASVESFPPQKLANSLLHHCHSHANANARGIAAQALFRLVQSQPQNSYDVDRVVQCAKEKLLHDNSVSSRAAAKGILTQLNETKNLDRKQQLHLHRIKLSATPVQDGGLSSTTGSLGKSKPPISRKSSFSSTTSSTSTHSVGFEASLDVLEKLHAADWQTRLDTLEEVRGTMQDSYDPILFQHVAEKANDAHFRVRQQAIMAVKACSQMYAHRIPPNKLATMLLPVAQACGERQSQKEALSCLQTYIRASDVAQFIRRHLKTLPPKANHAISSLLQ